MSIQSIEVRRDAILAKIRGIRSMTKGSVSEQYYRVKVEGKKGPMRRGPYYVFCRSVNNRTVSRRLTGDEVERARADVAAYKEFLELCENFVDLTHRLGMVEQQDGETSREKKRRKSRSNKTGR